MLLSPSCELHFSLFYRAANRHQVLSYTQENSYRNTKSLNLFKELKLCLIHVWRLKMMQGVGGHQMLNIGSFRCS